MSLMTKSKNHFSCNRLIRLSILGILLISYLVMSLIFSAPVAATSSHEKEIDLSAQIEQQLQTAHAEQLAKDAKQATNTELKKTNQHEHPDYVVKKSANLTEEDFQRNCNSKGDEACLEWTLEVLGDATPVHRVYPTLKNSCAGKYIFACFLVDSYERKELKQIAHINKALKSICIGNGLELGVNCELLTIMNNNLTLSELFLSSKERQCELGMIPNCYEAVISRLILEQNEVALQSMNNIVRKDNNYQSITNYKILERYVKSKGVAFDGINK